MEYFPVVALKLLAFVDPTKRLSNIYLKAYSFINYALVCGVGVFINMYILLYLANIMPLYLANLFAIFTAWTWNWNLTVGPLGYIMGLSPKKRKETQT